MLHGIEMNYMPTISFWQFSHLYLKELWLQLLVFTLDSVSSKLMESMSAKRHTPVLLPMSRPAGSTGDQRR